MAVNKEKWPENRDNDFHQTVTLMTLKGWKKEVNKLQRTP